jgi:hypothetical protein
MQLNRNMYGFPATYDDDMRALPMLSAHQVWKQVGHDQMRAVCVEASVSYDVFSLVRIGKKNFSYAVGRELQQQIFDKLRVVVNLDTLCNAIRYREHEEETERLEFEAAKVAARALA